MLAFSYFLVESTSTRIVSFYYKLYLQTFLLNVNKFCSFIIRKRRIHFLVFVKTLSYFAVCLK